MGVYSSEREGGPEVACDPGDSASWKFPDAEEAQDVVNAVRTEELCQLAQSAPPPGISILTHLLPVVGGEAPVLSIGVKLVWRGSSGGVHVEEVGPLPGVHTVARHSNGKVSLQDDMAGSGVLGCFC